jgi:hypothetical protein
LIAVAAAIHLVAWLGCWIYFLNSCL